MSAPPSQPLTQGKTKTILPGPAPGLVRMVTADALTAGDAAKRVEIPGLGALKTTQAARVFALLSQAGIATAFRGQEDPVTLLARDCRMLPLEFVVRRYAFGSYLKRHPDAVLDPPKRFDCPHSELFHKHAVVMPPLVAAPVMMAEGEARSRYLSGGVWAAGVHTDPYVERAGAEWRLHSAKAPLTGPPLLRIPPEVEGPLFARIMGEIVLPAFTVLEAAWARIQFGGAPLRLADVKMEVGLDRESGAPMLADVIDNDSWRLWPGGDPARQLDKQGFRDGDPLDVVEANYRQVTALIETLS